MEEEQEKIASIVDSFDPSKGEESTNRASPPRNATGNAGNAPTNSFPEIDARDSKPSQADEEEEVLDNVREHSSPLLDPGTSLLQTEGDDRCKKIDSIETDQSEEINTSNMKDNGTKEIEKMANEEETIESKKSLSDFRESESNGEEGRGSVVWNAQAMEETKAEEVSDSFQQEEIDVNSFGQNKSWGEASRTAMHEKIPSDCDNCEKRPPHHSQSGQMPKDSKMSITMISAESMQRRMRFMDRSSHGSSSLSTEKDNASHHNPKRGKFKASQNDPSKWQRRRFVRSHNEEHQQLQASSSDCASLGDDITEKTADGLYIASLLEQLNAVDRTDAESAIQEIDKILREEHRKCGSLVTQNSVASSSHARLNDTRDGRDQGSDTSFEHGVRGLPYSEPRLGSKKCLIDGGHRECDLDAFNTAMAGLEDTSENLVGELPNFEERRQSLARPSVSRRVCGDGHSLPGAYAAGGPASRSYTPGERPSTSHAFEERRSSAPEQTHGRRPSIFRRSFLSLRRSTSSLRRSTSSTAEPQAQLEINAILVDENEEERMRHRVEEKVRREVESELFTINAVAVEVDDSKAKKRRLAIYAVLFVILVATVIGLSVGLTGRNKESDNVLANVPETICYDRFPGQGHSLGVLCTRNETAVQGGGACNVVCKAFLDQTPSADVCITNAGACRADIAAGEFTRMDAEVMLPFENTLEVLEMTGDQVMQGLNDGLDFALDPLFGTTGAYPYGNAIRYHVDANRSLINNVEVNPRMEEKWIPIEMDRVYKVVTHTYLADGGDDYYTFANITDDKRRNTGKNWLQALIDYAKQVGVIEDLPSSEYSTQEYVAPSGSSRKS